MSSGKKQNHKKFYRYIRPFDWHQDPNSKDVRLASTAFKDGKGYSVDADSGRSNEECVLTLFERMTKNEGKDGILSFESTSIDSCQIDVIDEPEENNPHHCIFVDDKEVDPSKYRLNRGSKVKCLKRSFKTEK